MKTYIKKKAGPQKSPKYRTPDHFRAVQAGKGNVFSGKGKAPQGKLNPTTFRVQHRG